MARVPTHGLRHEAGLNAGRVLPLEQGRYAFGPKSAGGGAATGPDTVTFELEVNDHGVVLTPVGLPVAIDGRPVTVATPIFHGQIIEAGVDRFTLEPHERPLVAPAAPRQLIAPRLEALPSKSAVRRRRSKRLQAETQERRQRLLSQFDEDVEKTLRAESIGRRKGIGLPVEVTRSADQGVAHTLTRSGTVAIGLTIDTVAFNPDVSGNAAGEAGDVLRRYGRLSSVPFLVDFNHHRLGLVGPREAILSVSRHLLTSNATSSEPWLVDLRVDPERASDWGPLATLPTLARPVDRLLVLDGIGTDLDPPSAIVLADNKGALPIACSAVLTIDDDGSAIISIGDEQPANVVPVGIGADHAAELSQRLQRAGMRQQTKSEPTTTPAPTTPVAAAPVPQSLSGRPSSSTQSPQAASTTVASSTGRASEDLATGATGAVLVTGTDPNTTTEVLSSLTVDLLVRPENRNLAVHVIDARDRSLIRLRQLDQTRNYAPADDIAAIEALLGALERGLTTTTPKPAVLIANQIGPLLSFLERMERQDLVERLTSLIGFHDRVRLLVAASGPHPSDIDAPLLDRFATRLRCDNEQIGMLASGRDERTISISSLSGHDLTTSVASLVSAES